MRYLLPPALSFAMVAAPVLAGPTDHDAQLTVINGWQTKNGSYMAGLRIDLADGWKTYWRAPGDAGIPPLIDWTQADNIASTAFHWPVPLVFDQGGARSIGYDQTVTVPVEIFAQDPDQPIRLTGTIEIGVCDEICVPVSLDFDAPLTPAKRRNPEIMAALVNRPDTAAEAGIGAVTCAISPLSDGLQITTSIDMPSGARINAAVIETADPRIWVSQPDLAVVQGKLTATSDLIHVDGGGFAVDRAGVRITVFTDKTAIDIQGCRAP